MRVDRVIAGDCLDILPTLPDGSVDLLFADPPFNIGYGYDLYHDRRSKSEYRDWTRAWLEQARRLLAPSASLFFAIGDEFAAEIKLLLDELGLTLRNWIIWHYTFGVSCTRKFNRSHAHIFYYVVDPRQFTFHADAIRVPSARQTTYADRRANPRGKLPDDTWVLRPQHQAEAFRDSSDTWYEARVCGTFRERTGQHPCQMPEAVLERIIGVASSPGDLILDPFAGSGTTLVVARRLQRRFLGIELSPSYCQAISERLRQTAKVHSRRRTGKA